MTKCIFDNLPYDVKGFCCEDAEGYKTIVLNARLTHETNLKTYIHEIAHDKDFAGSIDVNELEKIRHE